MAGPRLRELVRPGSGVPAGPGWEAADPLLHLRPGPASPNQSLRREWISMMRRQGLLRFVTSSSSTRPPRPRRPHRLGGDSASLLCVQPLLVMDVAQLDSAFHTLADALESARSAAA